VLVKFLLPRRVDITGKLKLKDFNSMKKCIVWLGEIARGMTWDEYMAAVALDPFSIHLRHLRSKFPTKNLVKIHGSQPRSARRHS
jgi:hypothetical protein